jgi:hypothetical protein
VPVGVTATAPVSAGASLGYGVTAPDVVHVTSATAQTVRTCASVRLYSAASTPPG